MARKRHALIALAGHRVGVHALALALYTLVTLAFNWPLPIDLSGRLTGGVGGDTGVYVWNQWVFRHEIVSHGRFPLSTQEILSLSPSVDLSLHNYTLFADLLAFPLIPFWGVTATFNAIYLGLSVLTAWSMFLLARSVVHRTAEAWLAGALFGFSPILLARGGEHFSLAAAAPLPVFVWCLRRAEGHGYRRYALRLGAAAAWAAVCDPYYGVFCLVLAGGYLAARGIQVHRTPVPAGGASFAAKAIDATLLCLLVLTAGIVATGGGELRLWRWTIALRSLYTPVLAITILMLCRIYVRGRPLLATRLPPLRVVIRFACSAGGTAVLLLSPVLFAYWHALSDGAVLHGPTFWRSSPAGIDLLALVTPNPNHALFGGPFRDWLAGRANGYAENAASVTLVGAAVIGLAVWRYRLRPPRHWVVLTTIFAALALGPFVQIGGVNTFVPGPWALLRYVPIVTATRMPGRYAIPAMMLFSVLFAIAIRHVAERRPARRALVLGVVGAALLFELTPFPRRLYSAQIPDVYRRIAADSRDVRVLELPFGFRDGEWSRGDFTAASQFYQTVHQKRLIGGYLSRISAAEMRRQTGSPTVRSLMQMSEGRRLSAAELDDVEKRAPAFILRARLGYVVIDSKRTPDALRTFAIRAFKLVRLAEDDGRELYAPATQLARGAAVNAW